MPRRMVGMHPGRLNEVRALISGLSLTDFPRDVVELAGCILAKLPDIYHGDYLGQIITTVCVPNLLDLVLRLPRCHDTCDAICFLRKGAAISIASQMIRDTAGADGT